VESRLIEMEEMKMQMIQMKVMKVIHILKNMINQEFQHFAESQSIEMRKMKMHMIEFVSILNLIQMKLMKVISMPPYDFYLVELTSALSVFWSRWMSKRGLGYSRWFCSKSARSPPAEALDRGGFARPLLHSEEDARI
jgi:hypothetical protein